MPAPTILKGKSEGQVSWQRGERVRAWHRVWPWSRWLLLWVWPWEYYLNLFTKPPLPCLKNGNNNTCFLELWWRLNKATFAWCLTGVRAHRTFSSFPFEWSKSEVGSWIGKPDTISKLPGLLHFWRCLFFLMLSHQVLSQDTHETFFFFWFDFFFN